MMVRVVQAMILKDVLLVGAPVPYLAGGTGIIIEASPEVFKEYIKVCCIYGSATVKVTAAWITSGAWIIQWASCKIKQESSYIASINIAIAGKIPFAVAGIPDSITLRRIGVFLAGVVHCWAIIVTVQNSITVRVPWCLQHAEPINGIETRITQVQSCCLEFQSYILVIE